MNETTVEVVKEERREIATIVSPSLVEFCNSICQHARVGFVIDLDKNPPNLFGHLYETQMIRTVTTLDTLKKTVTEYVDGRPIIDRVAIMAHARAQRGKSKTTNKENEDE